MNDKRNSFRVGEFKTRAAEDGGKYIEGYFAVFNQRTELWAGTFEEIDPAAFDNSLKNNDIRCLYNHDTNIVLGRTGNKTLTLHTDAHGLFGSVRINENDKQALDIYSRVERGDVDGCSFGFFPISEEWNELPDGSTLWRVLDTDTGEVSICPFPAYPQTEIQARKKDFEKHQSSKATHRSREATAKNIKERLEKLKC